MAIFKPEKQYTEHALMDEVVYNTELILKEIVIKNQSLADKYETQEIVNNAEVYMLCVNGNITFDIFPFSEKILRAYGFNNQSKINIYLADREEIPKYLRSELLEFAKNYYIDNYIEMNNYYRALNGFPPVNSVYDTSFAVEKNWFPDGYDISKVDFSLKLHEQPKKIISILNSNGIIDNLIEKTTGKGLKYMYLRFLGSKKISIYDARKASKWDIIYIPNRVEDIVADRFEELYNINKEIFLNRHYQEAYGFDSEYYDEICILMLLCETFTNMITDIPEWYIRRDIFDIRSVQYFLDAYGVKYFKDIPLRFQIRIVKNLNKLIRYKSTDKNFKDILEIFSVENTDIYKYYLFKHQKYDRRSQEYTDAIELEFIQVKLDDMYDDYIRDTNNITTYDEITYADPYWDGVNHHDYVKQQHLNMDFTIKRSKYYSIDYKVSAKEYNFQTAYFLGLLFSTDMNSDDIRIPIPMIDEDNTFVLADVFLLVFCFSNKYYNLNSSIRRPEDNYPFAQVDSVPYDYHIISEEFYEWMKKYYTDVYQFFGKRRVQGFNLKASKYYLKGLLEQAHAKFGFRGKYTLEDLGVAEFITVWDDPEINSLNELYNVYHTNKKCYDALYHKIMYETNTMDEYRVYKFVFDYLFTVPFDDNYYADFVNLEEKLKSNDYALYQFYRRIVENGDNDSGARDLIRVTLDGINDTLDYYIKNHDVDYVLNNSAISSFFDIVTYIHHLLNFFKSFKAQFLDPYDTKVYDDSLGNLARPHDVISEMQIQDHVQDKQFVRDVLPYIEIEDTFTERPYHSMIWERMDIIDYIEYDYSDDYDYDGMDPANDTPFKDADGGREDHTDATSYPYFMLDAGKPQLNMKNIWDLDGSIPEEDETVEYFNVDGGGVYWEEDYEDPHYYIAEDYNAGRWSKEAQKFTFMIDGASPGTDTFVSRTMITRIEDHTFKQDVMISDSQYNKIKLTPDGLEIEQQWVSWKDYRDWQIDFNNTFNTSEELINNLDFLLEVAADEDALQRRVDICINNTLDGLRTSKRYMDHDALENSIDDYYHRKEVENATEITSINPFEWEDIVLR